MPTRALWSILARRIVSCLCSAFEGSIGLTAYFTPHPPADHAAAGARGTASSHTAAPAAPRKVKILRARLLDDVDASGSSAGAAAASSAVDDFIALCARRQLQPGAIVYLKRHRALALVTAAPTTVGSPNGGASASPGKRAYDGVWLDELHEEFKKAVSGETFANGYHITDATHHAFVDPPPVPESVAAAGGGATAAAAGAGVSVSGGADSAGSR